MSITNQAELRGMQRISEAVGTTLKKMREYAAPGMSTKELDEFGASILNQFGAKSAPYITYGFPGWTCISINHEIAHGIPSETTILQEGDLVNIDVSAELDGFFSDNGGSFILGKDVNNLNDLVETSKRGLYKALQHLRSGMKISEVGRIIESEAKKSGYRVIKNLVGHGIGRSLHEAPHEIPSYYDRWDNRRFKKNSVVAIETFISTNTTLAKEKGDDWTYIATDGSYVAQHEHTIVITEDKPIILTASNGIFDS